MAKAYTKDDISISAKDSNKVIYGTIISLLLLTVGIIVLCFQIQPIVKKEKEIENKIIKASESIISNSTTFYTDISNAPDNLSNMVVSYNMKDWSNAINYSTAYKLAMREIGENEYIYKIQLYSSYSYYELWRNNKSDLNSLSIANDEIADYINNYNSNSYKAYFTEGLINLGFSEISNSTVNIFNAIVSFSNANNLYKIEFLSNNTRYIYHIALSYCNISDLYTNYTSKIEMSNRIFFASKSLDLLKEIENYKDTPKLKNRALKNIKQ